MTPLSAVIITKNQEKKIGATIAALKAVTDDVVVVVDALSTDTTAEVAQQHGARVFSQKWLGYSAQKNVGNAQAKYDWILSVDDDEVVTPELAESIRAAFTQVPAYDAYDLRFQTVFCGQFIRFGGWNPESHVRIFNKSKLEWNTNAVHEELTLKPEHRIGKLKGLVLHFTVDSLEQFYEKTNQYSSLFAERGRKTGKKATFLKLYLSPLFRFLNEYLFRLGFLDGFYGFVIAKENARYTYLKYRKLMANK